MCLVIAPTRELAIQVNRELTWLYADAGAVVVNCVGGMDARREQRALNWGAHIVVGTPGRLRDHIERGHLDLSELKVAVLDEADEMLDMGFREDLEFILDAAPAERRTLLFSATLAREIVQLAKSYQNDALRIDTVGRNEPHRDIEYRAVRVAPNEIEHAIVNLLRYFESPGALVFCNTRESVRALHSKLRERGFAVVGLSGELSQRERADALQALRDGHARVCVATDVAARGLDLPDLGLVIHAELPVNKATLLHRSGRTGRAGKKGVSALVVPYTRRRRVEGMLRGAKINAEWIEAPTAEDIRGKDRERLMAALLEQVELEEDDVAIGAQLLTQRPAEEIAALLVRAHRASMPSPEELVDASSGPAPRDGPRPGFENTAWFRMPIGRQDNADPRWILPLLCRRGHITRDQIGAIRITGNETLFEIRGESAGRFMASVKRTEQQDGDEENALIIEAVQGAPREEARQNRREGRANDGPPQRRYDARPTLGARPNAPGRPAGARPPFKGKPGGGGKPFGGKPGGKPSGGKPYKAKRPD
jgi:ATP-dependent RNA helicase DeaD